ncbi:hypothetical protein TWF481_005820 [Arthrobotrys musiformis]|uniref:Uncharacterized protein n=1 Tax=Arthrobotrys musiformis TaxID=47236 RepID=A0AAV9WH02_9PEZI
MLTVVEMLRDVDRDGDGAGDGGSQMLLLCLLLCSVLPARPHAPPPLHPHSSFPIQCKVTGHGSPRSSLP